VSAAGLDLQQRKTPSGARVRQGLPECRCCGWWRRPALLAADTRAEMGGGDEVTPRIALAVNAGASAVFE
jgi:hypothetical protein